MIGLTPLVSRSDVKIPDGVEDYRVSLGAMGRSKEQHPKGEEVTQAVVRNISQLEPLVEAGAIRPLEYEVVDGFGWDAILKGVAQLEAGQAKHGKVVVRVQEE
jgi:NADPH:quinone reductase-like Zn-dependent oxidoreductase